MLIAVTLMFDEDIWLFINTVCRDDFSFGGMTVLSTFLLNILLFSNVKRPTRQEATELTFRLIL